MPSSILNSDDGVISGTSGLKSSGGDDGVLVFQSKGTETARINTDKQIVAAAGTASLPALTTTGDVNTGIFFPAADTIAFAEGGAEAMRITSDGRLGIGTTSPNYPLNVQGSGDTYVGITGGTSNVAGLLLGDADNKSIGRVSYGNSDNSLQFWANTAERMRINSTGDLLIGTTAYTGNDSSGTGAGFDADGLCWASASGQSVAIFNRQGNDGQVVAIRQAGTTEGNIGVSGTTVSFNGGHLSRWAQTTTTKDQSLVKGTVLSNLDAMNVYTNADGNPVQNEQLNKVKVSDVEGDANVAGVFVNWDHDEAHNVDEINMAMTGDMIIRIAAGTTVARGDLLMSAGDGTAKPQGDDIVRSKTIAKVTSTHVTCTYADGSFCVPCVLMAC
jgi:hypothetical protein